ncbi:hypothetical protein GGX14DRAFT_663309, partial [Mycena pura]
QGAQPVQGQLQYDMWGVTPTDLWDWDMLKAKITKHGLRNSLLTVPMPTVSTRQILGNNKCFEPYTSNIYMWCVRLGKFQVVNHGGCVSSMWDIPDGVKALYKTVWEIGQKKVLELVADHGVFICQSQSLNVHITALTNGQLTSMHFYGWKR